MARNVGWGRGLVLGLLCAACLPLQLGCGGRESAEIVRRPGCNVILVSIDTLRRDHLDLYGYRRPTTPHLDELAGEAVVFDDAVDVGGGTLPIHMSLLTSLHPLVHRVTPYTGRTLADGRVTLAESLKAQGYETAAFTDQGWVAAKFGFDQGFDLYDDDGGHFRAILPKARSWLQAHRAKKFFLFLHTFDVHSQEAGRPYGSPDESYNSRYTKADYDGFEDCIDGVCASKLLSSLNARILLGLDPLTVVSRDEVQHMVDLYDGSINYVDDELAGLFSYLRELGIYDDTLLIVTSDHGEEFLDHGFFLHRLGVHDEIARVPLIIRFPGGQLAGRRFTGLVSSVDVMPTVLDFLGLQAPPASDGLSVLPELKTGAHARRYEIIANAIRTVGRPEDDNAGAFGDTPWRTEAVPVDFEIVAGAIRTQDWKLVVTRNQLFDLRADPGEERNVFAGHRDVASRLREVWQQRVRELTAEGDALDAGDRQPAAGATLTPAEKEKLRSLGYLN